MTSCSPSHPLNVWIVNPYGWLPNEGWRDYRSAPLAHALAQRGHKVLWWISDIEHRSRTRRQLRDLDSLLPDGVNVELVSCRGYQRNISLARIRHERSFALEFARRSRELTAPDVIVLADPSLFFGGSVVSYAKTRAIPLVVDVIDLWPEMFNIVLPRTLRPLGRAAFLPLYRRRDRLVREAAALVAVTSDYLEQVTRREHPPLSEVVYLGRDQSAFQTPTCVRQLADPLEVIYAGNLGSAYDMPVLLEAIAQMARRGAPVRFTLAGDGPFREGVAALAKRYPEQLRFLGRVAPEVLPEHLARAHVGLATYSEGSTVSMPTKLFDYLAAGLATVGSMRGEAAELLRQGAGRLYHPGSAADLISAILHYAEHPTHLSDARHFAFGKAKEFDEAVQYQRFALLIEKAARIDSLC